MRKMISLFLAAVLVLAMPACNNDSTTQTPQNSPSSSPTQGGSPAPSAAPDSEPPQEPENVATLVVDFTGGALDLVIEQYELGYSGELTPKILLDGLSALTGLDFIADAVQAQMGIAVDWKNESTLIAGLDDRTPKEGFHFSDADSLRWFMMDSLYRTLSENFRDENIFYTMDGGKELAFEDLSPVASFPSNIPYMGFPFYFENADGQGFIYNEDEAASYLTERLAGAGFGDVTVIYEPDYGDPWFGEMAVWYFSQGENEVQMRFAVTYDWEIWEYDAPNEEWLFLEE